MLKYEEMKSLVFAHGSVPDGYFGDRMQVDFAFYQGRTIVVTPTGYHNSGLPLAIDAAESRWLLEHHPTARLIKLD